MTYEERSEIIREFYRAVIDKAIDLDIIIEGELRLTFTDKWGTTVKIKRED